MFTRRGFLAGSAAFALLKAAGLPAQTTATPQLRFNGAAYLFRWTNGRLFEFTPEGQEDLDKWTEMVSVLVLRDVNSPEKLADFASILLERYKARHGLLRTNTVPATAQNPAQHFVAGLLLANGIAECVFNRILLMHDIGYNFVYSHRNYGSDMKQTVDQTASWAKANGASIENAVMTFDALPEAGTLEGWRPTSPAARR